MRVELAYDSRPERKIENRRAVAEVEKSKLLLSHFIATDLDPPLLQPYQSVQELLVLNFLVPLVLASSSKANLAAMSRCSLLPTELVAIIVDMAF